VGLSFHLHSSVDSAVQIRGNKIIL